MSEHDNTHFFEKPANVRLVLRIFYGLCVLLLLGDFIIHRHIAHPWERLPGFYPLFGFVACVLLVLVAKEMRKVLMRREDYYERKAGKNAD